MTRTATATAPADRPRHLTLVTARSERESALHRVRRARRHVEAPKPRDPERFAYLKRTYD